MQQQDNMPHHNTEGLVLQLNSTSKFFSSHLYNNADRAFNQVHAVMH